MMTENTSWVESNVTEIAGNASLPHVHNPELKLALNVTLITLLLIIMLAMGCVITWEEVLKHLKRPVGVFIGMSSQFVLLPLVGFGLAHALQLSPSHAIGLLVLTCSPGGSTSNIFTYLSEGDVSLSVVMTLSSTVLALGLMPVNLLLYSRSWTSDHLIVPYEKIAFTLILILLPVIVGMGMRWKLPKVAEAFSKVGSAAGLLAIISTMIMQSILYPNIFRQPWTVWFAGVLLPILGFLVGFMLSWLSKQPFALCRTVAIETGAQNVSLALTVLILSFPAHALEAACIVPLLFSIFVLAEGAVFCLVYRGVTHFASRFKFEPVAQTDTSSSSCSSSSNGAADDEKPVVGNKDQLLGRVQITKNNNDKNHPNHLQGRVAIRIMPK